MMEKQDRRGVFVQLNEKIYHKKQGGGVITEVKKKAKRLDKTKGEMRRALTLFLAIIKLHKSTWPCL